jgi:hypothetical protein
MKHICLHILFLFARNFNYKSIESNFQILNEIETENNCRHKLSVTEIDIVACRPVARQRPLEKLLRQPLLSNGFTKKHVCTATTGSRNRGTVFSVRSVPRCYKQDSVSVESSGSGGRGQFENPEEGAFRRWKRLPCSGYYSDIWSVQISETIIVVVVTFCKGSINPITNPNPVYSHSKFVTISSVNWP